MVIKSSAPVSKVDTGNTVLDMVSDRSAHAMFKAMENERKLSSDSASLSAHSDQIKKNIVDIANNVEDITSNSNCVFDLADVLGEISESLFELADYIGMLDERLTAIEESEE